MKKIRPLAGKQFETTTPVSTGHICSTEAMNSEKTKPGPVNGPLIYTVP
jgi:hypothetical protein